MAWAAVAVGVGSAVVGGMAANNAANTQAGALGAASAQTQAQYNQSRADTAPYRQAGYTALGQLQDPSLSHNFGASDFTQDPGYQFRLEQGQKALQRSAAAQGNLMSGDTLTALTRYNQDQASNEYQNAYSRFNTDRSNNVSRLQNIASLGAGQTATSNQLGADVTHGIGNNMAMQGQAQASGQMGMANAISGGAGMGVNAYLQQEANNKYGLGGSGSNISSSFGYNQGSTVPQTYSGRLGTIGGT